MSKTETVMEIMLALRVADKHPVGKVMAARGYWTAGTSASNNSYKVLDELASAHQLEKGKGFFRVPRCASDYGPHARLLTRLLAEILALPFEAVIHREHPILSIGLRPDALILLSDRQRALCFVLEAVNLESDRSLETKRNVWHQWPDAPQYLSHLFKVTIPHFDFVRSDELDRYLQEVVYETNSRRMSHLHPDVGTRRILQAPTGNQVGGQGSGKTGGKGAHR